MAIIGRTVSGFLVDHEKSISEAVSALLLSCKEGLFALFEPYFRSAAENTDGKRKRKVSKIDITSIKYMFKLKLDLISFTKFLETI